MFRYYFSKPEGIIVVNTLRNTLRNKDTKEYYECPAYQKNEQKSQEKYCSYTLLPLAATFNVPMMCVSSYTPETTAIIDSLNFKPFLKKEIQQETSFNIVK